VKIGLNEALVEQKSSDLDFKSPGQMHMSIIKVSNLKGSYFKD